MASPLFNINSQNQNQGTGKFYTGSTSTWSTNYKKSAVQNTVAAINNSYNNAFYYLSNSIGDEEKSYKNARTELDNLKKSLNVLENLRGYIGEDILSGADYDSIVSQATSRYDELMGKYTRDYASFRNLAGAGTTPFKLTSGIAKGYEMTDMEETEIAGKTFGEKLKDSWLGNVAEASAKGYAGQMAAAVLPAVESMQKAAGTSGYIQEAQVNLDSLRREREANAAILGEEHAYIQTLDNSIRELEEQIARWEDEGAFRVSQEEKRTQLKDMATGLTAQSEAATQAALNQVKSAGTIGRWLTQGAVSGTQMLADAALGGMPAMTVRMFGVGVQEGIANGYDTKGQIALGVKAAAITYLTEKLFGGNPLIDKTDVGVVNRVVQALGGNKKLLTFLDSAPMDIVGEGFEEVLESVANWIVDKGVGASTDKLTLQSLIDDFVVGAMVAGVGKAVGSVDTVRENARAQEIYGDSSQSLVEEALALDPDSKLAQRMASRLEKGEELSGSQLRKLMKRNDEAVLEQSIEAVAEAASARLTELGETGDVHAIGKAIAKQAMGLNLNIQESRLIKNSTYASEVAGTLDTENIVEEWFARMETQDSPPELVEGDTELEAAEAALGDETGSVLPAADIEILASREAETLLAKLDGMTEGEATVYLSEKSGEYLKREQEALRAGDSAGAEAYYELGKALTDAALNSAGSSVLMVDLAKRNLGGFANAEGTDISDGAGRWNAGESAGIEAGRMESQQDRTDAGGEGLRGQNDQQAYGAVWESARDLGIPQGTEEKIIRRTPLGAWTAEMRGAAREAAELGYSLEYVNGSITVRNPVSGKSQRMTGVIYGQSIVVQADHRLYSAEQLAKHEIMHARLSEDPAMREEIVRAFAQQHGEQEVRQITSRYADGYGFIYGVETEGMTADEIAALEMMYLEEFICDAAAGINRSFMGGGNKATRYGGIVLDIVQSRIGMGNGSGGMPGVRYSFHGYDPETGRGIYGGNFPIGTPNQKGQRKIEGLTSNYPELMENSPYAVREVEEDTSRYSFGEESTEAGDIANREQSKELNVLDPRNLARYRGEVYLMLNGEMPSHKSILVGRTPEILVRYGALDAPLYMPQKAVKKAVLGASEKGGKHGLGEGVIYDLPRELADPIAITGNTSSHKAADDRSIIVWTRWASENGDPIIVPIRIDISAEKGERANNINTVFDVYDEIYREGLLTEDNILYTKNNESIDQLLAQWREVPKWAADDAFNTSIREYQEKVNAANKNPAESAKWSADDDAKAPEEMSMAELRKTVQEDAAMLETYKRFDARGRLDAEMKAEMETLCQRLQKETEVLKERKEAKAAEQKEARERAKARVTPTKAKEAFCREMLGLFSIPNGMREELGTMADRFAEDAIREGRVSHAARKVFIDRLYDSGVARTEVDPYYADMRSNIAGAKIYVPEDVRSEFGDDYNDFKRSAFAAGVYLTSDRTDGHIDGFYHELAGMYPGAFRSEGGDFRRMLEEIVDTAKLGKSENMSLAEMMSRLQRDYGYSLDEQMDALERKVDTAIEILVRTAGIETEVKSAARPQAVKERVDRIRERSAVQMAQERAERKEKLRRQAEARNLREMQQKTMKSLQWLKRNERRMTVDMKAQAEELLDGLDLYAISIANEMRWSDKHQATWRDLADMYQSARDHDSNFLPSKELEMIWSRVNLKKVGELDLDALETLYRAASALRTEFYNRNNVINDEEHRMFSEAYADSVEEIRTSGGKGKTGKMRTFFNAEQLTPVNMLERMGGWRRNGTFFSFARMLESGERGYKGYVVEANRQLQGFIEEHQDWIKIADGQGKDAIWYEEEVPELLELHMGDKPIFGETKKVYMTPAQKVHLYLESMNYQNLRHMAGGRTFVNRDLYEQGKRTEALAQGTTIRLAPESVKKLVSDLTEEEMALAKILQQYYNVFASERINKVSNPLYGYDKAVTKDYAPIFSNRNYTKTEPGVYDMTAEGVGHMKGREQYSKNPSYNISAFDAFERHVEQTARFVGYSIPVRNMNTLMNWQTSGSSMRDEITHVWGEEGAKYIEDYIKKLQSPVFPEKDTIQKATGKLMSNYISGVFAANPSVVLKQLLSYPMAGSVLGFSNMPTPVQIARTDSKLIARYTPELEYRRMGYATPEIAQLKDNPNWTQTNKLTRFIFGGGAITWTDAGAARALWPWAENYVRKNYPDLEIGTQEQIDAGQSPFYRKVAELYNDAVTNTQSMSDTSHRPKIMNSDNAITKAFTMFKSDSAQAYNTIRRLGGELARATKDGDKAKARMARTQLAAGVTAIILSQLGGEAINFLMALWKNKAKWYRDDEDELTAQSVGIEYLSGLGKSTAGIVVFGEELMQVVLAAINHEDWSFQNGIEVPGMEQLNDFIDKTLEAALGMGEIVDGAFEVLKNDGDLGKYLADNTGKILGIIKDTAITMGQYIAGFPTANLEKYLLGAVKWISPELASAYENRWFGSATKNTLAGLKGRELEATVGDVLTLRDIQADDETAAELARLYETGQKTAVPGTVNESFAVNGQDFTMNAAQMQVYKQAYAEAMGGNLDALVESDAYIESEDEVRAKMLDKLYTYAAQTAKRAVAPDYEGDTWSRKAAEAESNGVPVSVYAALQAQGLTKTAEKMDYIDGMDITEDQKAVLYYYAVASGARMEDVDAMMDAGMSWGKIYRTMTEYMAIEGTEDLSANEKAATFKTWAYGNLSSGQMDAAVENLTFSSGFKASTDGYDELVELGMDPDDALAVMTAWGNLEPENGASSVNSLQKMNALVEKVSSEDARMSGLQSILSETQAHKLTQATTYGVNAAAYVKFQNTLEDYYDWDPNGSVGALSQNEVTAALQSMTGLSNEAKAALWQIQTMGKDGKNNPFDTSIGKAIYDDYQTWKETGEETAAKEEDDTPVRPKGWIGNYEGLQLPVW